MVSCAYSQKQSGHLLFDGVNSSSSNQHKHTSKQELQDGIEQRTTDGQTMAHILKANVGTGILAMPAAFKNVGLWSSLILLPIIGIICIHCMNILISSHNKLCDIFNFQSLDFDQTAALALALGPKSARRLAKWAHLVVTIFLIFTQFGFCCVYIMFVVENVQLAVLNLFQVHYSTTTYLIVIFPIIGLTSCTSNLKHLARISTLANLLQLTGLALIFYDLLQFHTYSSNSYSSTLLGEARSNNSLGDAASTLVSQSTSSAAKIELSLWASSDVASGLPLFFATAVYAFEGIGVVLPLIKEMQCPERMSGLNGVLNTSMSIVAILYMGMGFFGYSKYGQFVQGSITLNLPKTTLNELVRVIFATAIGLSFCLQFYVPWTIMWPTIDEALFYSYRPRESRDKLDILNKLSAENEWAFEESDIWQQRQQTSAASSRRQSISAASRQATFAASHDPHDQEQEQHYQNQPTQFHQSSEQTFEIDSNASTLASSFQLQSARSRINYGSFKARTSTSGHESAIRRNRLEDVMEQPDDSLPDIRWRPPPNTRSLRWPRKLTRYTVILLSVSFTFVAAALIPRLDLFIALIGALASSCLAIIFPAIIQACTFWHIDEEGDDVSGATRGDSEDRISGRELREEATQRARRQKHRLFLWWLFIGKNVLLVLFGILGLITGSWISLSKLGAVYMGIEAEQ